MSTIAVLGPGAIGGVLAVRLAQAGEEVVCVARRATAEAIRSEGLTLRQGPKTVTEHPQVVERLTDRVDLLLVTVKAPALDDALGRVTAGAAAIVPLLNGVEHMDTIRTRLSGPVIAGSVGRVEAYRAGPATIVHDTPALVLTLTSDADHDTVELLQAGGTDVRVDGAERDVLWEKLARQAAVAAATASTQRSIGELRADPAWRLTLEAAVAEGCAVAAAHGVLLSTEAQWEIIDAMPPELTSSTARDVAAGRPSELDAITGAAVRAGRRVGVPTPTLEELLEKAEDRCRAQSP